MDGLHLIDFQLHGSFPAEHGNGNAHLVFFQIDFVHDTGEVLHEVAGDDKETENSENTENNTENNNETETAASANSVKVDLFSLYQFDR